MVEKKHMAGDMDHRQLIRLQVGKLAELLCQSPEYIQFLAARRRLEADGENADILAELRQRQMSMRMASLLGDELDFSEEYSEFENMYLLLAQEPSISEYLFAEGRLFRLIADVEAVFSDKLDLGMTMEEAQEMQPRRDIRLN